MRLLRNTRREEFGLARPFERFFKEHPRVARVVSFEKAITASTILALVHVTFVWLWVALIALKVFGWGLPITTS